MDYLQHSLFDRPPHERHGGISTGHRNRRSDTKTLWRKLSVPVTSTIANLNQRAADRDARRHTMHHAASSFESTRRASLDDNL